MARSIGDWYADHTRGLPDDAPDDEVVEPPAIWDLRSSDTTTGRSGRRDSGYGIGRNSRRTGTGSAGRTGAVHPDLQRSRRSAGSTVAQTSAGKRRIILAAMQANPRADAKSLAAFLTRHGTPVSAAEVAAVKDALASPFTTSTLRAGRLPERARRAMDTIEDVVRANPHLGKKALVAKLQARGVSATKAQVGEALLKLRSSTAVGRNAATGVRRGQATPRTRASRKTPSKPALVIKVRAGAQASRTAHETPLCPSCGVRVSIYGGCRCS